MVLLPRDLDDELIENQDLQRKIYPDAVGIYAWQSINDNDYITGGLCCRVSLDVTFRNPSDKQVFSGPSAERSRHGWWIHLPRDGSKLELNSWLKYVPHAPFHFDANIRYQIGQDIVGFLDRRRIWNEPGHSPGNRVHLAVRLPHKNRLWPRL